MLSYKTFYDECRAQGVELCENLANPDLSVFDASEHLHEAVFGLPVSRHPISDTSFCVDAVSKAHATLINSTHGVGPVPRFTIGKTGSSLMGCKEAEVFFGKWLAGVDTGKPVGGSIIVDEHGSAVAINKRLPAQFDRTLGEAACILLEDVGLVRGEGTITIPRGALTRLYLPVTRRENPLAFEPAQPKIIPFSEVLSVFFARMTGIDLNDADWKTYYGNYGPRPKTMRTRRIWSIVNKALVRLGND